MRIPDAACVFLTIAAACLATPSAFASELPDPSNLDAIAGLPIPWLFFLLVFATFISEDLTCISAGLLAANGSVSLVSAIAACFLGIYIGDGLLYLAGRHLGSPTLRRAPFRWILNPDDIRRSTEWFQKHGPMVIFASRFVPGTRFPTYVASGVLQMSYLRFSLYFFLAALVWTPLLVGVAALVGHVAIEYLEIYRAYAVWIFIGIALLLWILIHGVVPLFSFRGRRLLLSRWKRIRHWEFWPPQVFYLPLIPYLLGLGLRHRGLTVFTAANPCIPAGGFIGESKCRILYMLRSAGDHVARWTSLSPEEGRPRQLESIDAFLLENRLEYPLVMKPDQGQRGAGVAVIRSRSEASAYLEDHRQTVLVQEFAPGLEFGIFYVRRPGSEQGEILSITDKRFLCVTGDGKRTLQQLILSDPRAVCMARLHLRCRSDRIYEVPASGEDVPLVEVGTHCRGALFLDGSGIRTEALAHTIDAISRDVPGFFFGRYDIRTPSLEDFQRGENFKIVELNGVTSEVTHIYDPSHSLWSAYRDLFHQWRLAVEIGAANRDLGVPTTGLVELLRMTLKYRRTARG